MNETGLVPATVQLVGEAIAGESTKVKKELEKLLTSLNKSTFDVADLLHKVKKFGYYRPEFDTFAEYLKTLDIKRRKGQYLERITDVMEQVDIERTKYEPLGIAKLREITSLDPNSIWKNPTTGAETPMKDFIHEFVNEGATMSQTEIHEHVQTLKGFTGENELVNKTFAWLKSTYEEVIEKALELAKRNIGSVGRDPETGAAIDPSDSKAMEVISIEYINTPANNVLNESVEQEYIVEE
jgi:hypothetical protein